MTASAMSPLRRTVKYDSITQISHTNWYWSTDAEKDFWVTPLQMRRIFPQEMPLLVAFGGLRLIERFGDFDRSPLRQQAVDRYAYAHRRRTRRIRFPPSWPFASVVVKGQPGVIFPVAYTSPFGADPALRTRAYGR